MTGMDTISKSIPSLRGRITAFNRFISNLTVDSLPAWRDYRGALKRPDSESIPSLRGGTTFRL